MFGMKCSPGHRNMKIVMELARDSCPQDQVILKIWYWQKVQLYEKISLYSSLQGRILFQFSYKQTK